MGWTHVPFGGRITTLVGAAVAGVADDGRALYARLADVDAQGPAPAADDSPMVDSVGVLGISDSDSTYVTGRGWDGRVHLWCVGTAGQEPASPTQNPAEPPVEPDRAVRELELAGFPEPMWAAPIIDEKSSTALTAHLASDGEWRLQARGLLTGVGRGAGLVGRELHLGAAPDLALDYSSYAGGPAVVVGVVGDGPDPRATAWALAISPKLSRGLPMAEWRRVALDPVPTAMSSVARCGEATYLAGRDGDQPVIYKLWDLNFRGPMRTATVLAPPTELDPTASDGASKPVVLVAGAEASLPVVLTASVDGNWLWWLGPDSWFRVPAPPGRLRAASFANGQIWAHVDGGLWSLPDPIVA
jgi:hypothetical protein